MKRYIIFLAAIATCTISAQTWQVLPNSPSSRSFRHDDLFFLNKDTGWVCNVDGEIYRTNDGGISWTTQIVQPKISFRCIGFSDPQKGWAGNLGPGRWSQTVDTMPLYSTIDGGLNWQAVSAIQGALPKGICGINVVNDSVVYAVGRVGGPAYLLKTTNGGTSWISIDMNHLAFQLIDCKFFSPDTGIVIGGYPNYVNSNYRILYTADGGLSWQIVASGKDPGQLAWKAFFVNRGLGYVSVESGSNVDSLPVLKSNDGGLTWQKKIISPGAADAIQGIGFINDSIGWCGGFNFNAKLTTDGGNTWNSAPTVLSNLNRIRKVNDTLAYAAGNRVWKYTTEAVGINSKSNFPEGFHILSVFPNPFRHRFTIQYHIPASGHVFIRLYDFAGRPVKIIDKGRLPAGGQSETVEIPYYGNTHFFAIVQFGDYHIPLKLAALE